MEKKTVFLILFVAFTVGNGLLRRYIAGKIESFTFMILMQGTIQLFVSISMTKKYLFYDRKIFFLVVCSYTCHLILWICNKKLKSITLSMIEPTRILFAVILTIILIKKKYSYLQYFSIFLIISGIVISKVFEESHDKKIDQIAFIFLSVFGSFVNAVSSVAFVRFFNSNNIKFWTYIFTFSIYATILYLIGFTAECLIYKNFKIKEIFDDKKIFIMPFSTTIEYLGYRFIGFHTCPVEKNLIIIIIQISIPIVYNIFFKREFDFLSILTISIVYAGSFLFEAKNILLKLNCISRNDSSRKSSTS